MTGAAGPASFNAAFPDEAATGRIDPLLIAPAPEQSFGEVSPGLRETSRSISSANDIFFQCANVAARARSLGYSFSFDQFRCTRPVYLSQLARSPPTRPEAAIASDIQWVGVR
jgi:hypothetical protein